MKNITTASLLQELEALRRDNARFQAQLSSLHNTCPTLEPEEIGMVQLFDLSPIPKWIYHLDTLRFLTVNPAAVALYGYTQEEFLQMTIKDICAEEEVPAILADLPASRPAVRFSEMREHRTKTGQTLIVRVTSNTLRYNDQPVVLVSIEDFTMQTSTLNCLEESEAFNRSVLDSMVMATAVLDHAGKVIAVNEAWRQAVCINGGDTKSYFVGYNYLKVCQTAINDGQTEVASIQRGIKEVLKGERASFDAVYCCATNRGGEWFLMRVMSLKGRHRGAVISHIDITGIKRAEARLAESHKMESIGRLAGGIAHDFNNMLTVILGYAELLAEGQSAQDPGAHYVYGIHSAAKRAAELTSQILGFARRQMITPRKILLNQSLLENWDLLKTLLSEGRPIECVLDERVTSIMLDPGQLTQLLVNLCLNARDAMPEGGTITLRTFPVTLKGDVIEFDGEEQEGEFVALSVTDTGTGIAGEHLPHIFEPFFTSKLQGKGTGLGLATCYGIMHQNGGLIGVKTQPGTGTTITLYFPRLDETTISEVSGQPAESIAQSAKLPLPAGTSFLPSCSA